MTSIIDNKNNNKNNSSVSFKLEHNGEIRRVAFTSPLNSLLAVQVRAQTLFPQLASIAPAVIRFSYVDADHDTITVGCDSDLLEALTLTNKLTVVVLNNNNNNNGKTVPVAEPSSSSNKSADNKSSSFPAFVDEVTNALKADAEVQQLARNFGVSLHATLPEILAQVRANPFISQLIGQFDISNDNDDDDEDVDEEEQVKKEQVKQPVVHNATCDGCNTRIVGLRFKCASAECPDFDFCERCYTLKTEIHPASHMFNKIAEAIPFVRGMHCGGRSMFGQHGGCPRFVAANAAAAGCGRSCVKPTAAPAAAAPAGPAPVAASAPVVAAAAPVEPQPQYELEQVAQQGEVTLAPGQEFVKLFKIKNTSNEVFEAASLLHTGGDRIGNVRIPIGKIGAGEERFVAVDIEAPVDAAGKRLLSVYRLMRNIKHVVQGEPIIISVQVKAFE